MTAFSPNTGFVLAGTQSSSGKTLVNAMVLSALRSRNITCQPFKTGPDYIDAAYSGHYAGCPSYNLDYWMMGADALLELALGKTRSSLGVVEGVMGLFDGVSPESSEGSTFSVAKWLGWPVFLIIPAAKQGRSIRAILRGFVAEAGEGLIRGVILNKVSGQSHAEYIKRSIVDIGIPVVGAVPLIPDMVWPERHLGLRASQEWVLPSPDRLNEVANQYLDLDMMLTLAASNRNATCASQGSGCGTFRPWAGGKRLAIAQDEAFHFYYQGNLDALSDWGFELIPFSPLRDHVIPEDADGLLLGGGFPEIYARDLASNQTMRDSIRGSIEAGLPCYAECGGFMYLCESITLSDAGSFPMVGVVPGGIVMTDRLQSFGYSEASFSGSDRSYRGHEFHHSIWERESDLANLWFVKKPSRSSARMEGYSLPSLHASYLHLYFPGAEGIFERLFGNGTAPV